MAQEGTKLLARGWVDRVCSVLPAVILFQARVGLWLVNPLRAPNMLVNDWTTYIIAPNFLRSARILSLPIGLVPGYLHPVGSSLGNSDAAPYLLPVYRGLISVFPGRPIQLVGLLLLTGYVGTYLVVYRFCRRQLAHQFGLADDRFHVTELVAVVGGLLVAGNPILGARFEHASLMQQWILALAIIFTLERRVLVQGAPATPPRSAAACVLLISLASVINPYFAPMVWVALLPVLASGEGDVARRFIRTVLSILPIVPISLLLGYAGSGKRPDVLGYGNYNADLLTIFNPTKSSKSLRLFTPSITGFEGRSFIGLGALCLIPIVLYLGIVRPSARLQLRRAIPLIGVSLVALLYSALPVVRFAAHPVFSTNLGTGEALASRLFSVLRTNARLAWPLAYTTLLLAVAVVILNVRSRIHVFAILSLFAAVQLVDSPVSRPPTSDPARYEGAYTAVKTAKARGVTQLSTYPAWVKYECPNDETDIAKTAPVLLAASVLGIAVNTGYPARGDERYLHDICERNTAEFLGAVRRPGVAFLVPLAFSERQSFDWCVPDHQGFEICGSRPS